MMKIALAGNPNSGKTTLFNALTGSNQYVGNWPGVTVEKKEGKLKENPKVIVQDLPGVYSLSPYSPEERIARNYLIQEHPDVILNIVDASNLERNLYLSTQLAELGIPMVIALNMMDVIENRNETIDVDALSNNLGIPVIEMSASKNKGTKEAAAAALKAALHQPVNCRVQFDPAIEEAIKKIESMIIEPVFKRWKAIRLLENDEYILERQNLSSEQLNHLEKVQKELEQKFDDKPEGIIADQRYSFIEKNLQNVYKKKKGFHLTISDKIDRIVTNRFLAIPIFMAVMAVVYYLSLNLVGTPATDFVNDVIVGEWLQGGMTSFFESVHASEPVISLVVDGIIGGLGAPFGFLPQMVMMFLCLSFLEDCGYMSRIAFIMDRIFRKLGLSGKSFISFMISTGCGIPGIMAARTIENEKERRMTMIVTTSMPCSAKLPIIAMIAGAISGVSASWQIAWATYMFGIVAIIISALVLRHTRWFAGETAPFIMELPSYHWPKVMNVLRQTWERCLHFIKKAGTILFACCVVTWFLSTYGITSQGLQMVDIQDSLLAKIGSSIAFLFAPLGWGNWQAAAASLSGFVAKEQIVSTMGVLVNVADDTGEVPELWSAIMVMFPNFLAAFSFLVFNLLDAPCLAAVSTLFKEMNSSKWSWMALGWQMFFAWSMALIVYQLGSLLFYGTFGIWTMIAVVILIIYIARMVKPYTDRKTASKNLVEAGA